MAWHRITPDIAERLSAYLRGQYAPRTVNRHLAAVRGVLVRCRRNRWLDRDTFDDVAEVLKARRPKGRVRPGNVLTDDDVRKLFEAATAQQRAILALGIGAGLRREEIADLRVEHVDFVTGVVAVHSGKGDKDRTTVLPTKALGHVTEWFQSRAVYDDVDRPLLTLSKWAVWDSMRQLASMTGVRFTTHDLRRAWVTRQLRAGTDARFVQSGAGHESVETTMQYDMRAADEAIAALRKVDLP